MKFFREGVVFFVFSSLILSLGGCGGDGGVGRPSRPLATVENKGTHYEVVLNYETGATPREVGQAFGRELKRVVPDIEALLDRFVVDALEESLIEGGALVIPPSLFFKIAAGRIRNILPQVPEAYREELYGVGDILASTSADIPGDGKISMNEILGMNLALDIARTEQCCALTVFGARSATGGALSLRLQEGLASFTRMLRRLHCVTFVQNGPKSIVLIQPLGFLGAIAAINDDGVFASVLDSPTHQTYSSKDKRSYPMDLRYAMENFSTLEEVAAYMKDDKRPYAYNHVIFMSDASTGKVLENNFSGAGVNMRRALRTSTSELNEGIAWHEPEAIATVTSFVLKGNDSAYHWGHREPGRNSMRWESMRRLLSEIKGPISPEKLKAIMTYHEGDVIPRKRSPSDLYSYGTQMLILFDHASMALEVAFLPPDHTPAKPIFEPVFLPFGSSER